MLSTQYSEFETQDYIPHQLNGYAVYPGRFVFDEDIKRSVELHFFNFSALCFYGLKESQYDDCLAPTFSSWVITRLSLNTLDLCTVQKIMNNFNPIKLVSISLASLSDESVELVYEHLHRLCQITGRTFKVICNSATISSNWQLKFDGLMLSQTPAPRVAHLEATLQLLEDEKRSLQAQLFTQQQAHDQKIATKDQSYNKVIVDLQEELTNARKKKRKFKNKVKSLAAEVEASSVKLEQAMDASSLSDSAKDRLNEYEVMLFSAKETEYDLHDTILQLKSELQRSESLRAQDQMTALNQMTLFAGICRGAAIEKERKAASLDSSSCFFQRIRLRRVKSKSNTSAYEVVRMRC